MSTFEHQHRVEFAAGPFHARHEPDEEIARRGAHIFTGLTIGAVHAPVIFKRVCAPLNPVPRQTMEPLAHFVAAPSACHKVDRIAHEMLLDARHPGRVLHVDGQRDIVIVAPLAWRRVRVDDTAGEFVELSSIVLPDKVFCKTCKGVGHYTVTDCDECEGSGLIYDDAVGYTDCAACAGYGFNRSIHGREEMCDDCNGMGEEQSIIPVGVASYQRKYLAQLQALPNCKFSPVENQGSRFEFDGGFGWLMPVIK